MLLEPAAVALDHVERIEAHQSVERVAEPLVGVSLDGPVEGVSDPALDVRPRGGDHVVLAVVEDVEGLP